MKRQLESQKLWYVFHFTHINNLESILGDGLIPKWKGIDKVKADISNQDVQARRARKSFPVSNGKIEPLHNLVPTYLAKTTPTIWAHSGRIEDIVILKISASVILSENINYVFTDGNAASSDTNSFWNLKKLQSLPWHVIRGKKWNDVPDGKRKRCAELLIAPSIPTKYIKHFYVSNNSTKARVKTILLKAKHQGKVEVDRYRFPSSDGEAKSNAYTPTPKTSSPDKTRSRVSIPTKVEQKPKATQKPIPRAKPTPAKKRQPNRPQNKTTVYPSGSQPTTKPRATRNTNKTKSPTSAKKTLADSDRQIASANSYGLLVVCLMAAIIPALVLISSLNKRELDPKETQDSVVVDPSKWYMGDVKPKDTSSPSDSSNPSNARSPMAQTTPKKPRTPISNAETAAPPIPPVLSGDVITLIHDSKPPLRFRLVKSLNLYVAETELTNSQIRQITGEHYSDDNKPFILGSLWKQDNFIPSLTLRASSLLKDRLDSGGYDLRLPTYEEWERYSDVKLTTASNADLNKYAVHSMNSGRYLDNDPEESLIKWGDIKYQGRYSQELSISQWTKYLRNNDCKPQQVKSKLPNQYGLYDCIGNVAELLPARTIDGNRLYQKVVGSYATPPEFLTRPKQTSMSWSEAPLGSAFNSDWYFKDVGIRFVIEKK